MIKDLHDVVVIVEDFCNREKIEHRFVGGVAYSGILTAKTTFQIDPKTRIVHLFDHETLPVNRADGTVRDVDLIVFCSDQEKLVALRDFLKNLDLSLAMKNGFPFVSVENAIYSHKEKLNKALQFVTSIRVEDGEDFGKGQALFCFENICEEISWQSLESWTVVLDDGRSYTTRNPYADLLGYLLRSPIGYKPKDKEKLEQLERLAEETVIIGKKAGIDYLGAGYYQPWLEFFQRMAGAKGVVGVKREMLRAYWKIFGTKLAHGKGPVAKLLSRLGNQFTGIRQ